MSDYIFYAIVGGDIPDRIVHETDQSLAFLDTNSLAPGHTLVVSKERHTRLDGVLADTAADLSVAVNDLVPRVEAAADADATNVGINDSPAAGQEVDHVHVHIVPRLEGNGGSPIHAIAGERPGLSDEELADIEAAISSRGHAVALADATSPAERVDVKTYKGDASTDCRGSPPTVSNSPPGRHRDAGTCRVRPRVRARRRVG